ncbi:MAG: HEAT repeat domain-containing protein, partial [Phycisphaeraceae bacterium]
HGAEIDAALRRELWVALVGDASQDVSSAAMSALRAHTDLEPADASVIGSVRRAMASDDAGQQLAAVRWIAARPSEAFADGLTPLLTSDTPAIRAACARALRRISADHAGVIIEKLRGDRAPAVQVELAEALLLARGEEAREALFRLLERCRPAVREEVASAAYRFVGGNRAALARVMPYDPSLEVNIAGLRLAERIADPALLHDLLPGTARDHRNEYVRARALRMMAEQGMEGLNELCAAAIGSPYWVLRLEAADILADTATAAEADALREVLASTDDAWLRLALEDALAKAEGRPAPEKVRLGLGETSHTEGGDDPAGFQVWLGRMPSDRAEARRMVERGYRFGVKTRPPNMPGGPVLNAYNRSADARNIYLLDAVLEPLEQWENQLPLLYYIALFDEPGTLGTGFSNERVRAMVLEAGRPDLLEAVADKRGDDLAAALPPDLRRAYAYYNARFGGVASNWVVHMFRLTAQRKYPDLNIFPQSLTYMRGLTDDAFDMIDADGDYAWKYHHGNFFRDGTMGAINRVINPGKPMNMITWMGWHRPNIINGNKLFADSNYPEGPWRFRNYMGTKSALALWATGVEAGFFDSIGFGKVSDRDAQGLATVALKLKPWSEAAHKAVEFMIDDADYWEIVEGKLELEQLDKKQEDDDPFDRLGDEPEGETFTLEEEDETTPVEKALQSKREQLYEKLMTGVSYMNIFGTDTTRALSNLPKPDTSKRDTLIIMGRDANYYMDGPHMPMPAIAVVQGFDMAPNYDSVEQADLMHYDTILLRRSSDGVTSGLIKGINRWLREKEDGLLVVWGDVTSEKALFPEITLESVEQSFPWEAGVQFQRSETTEETFKDRRGREKTREVRPRLSEFTDAAGKVAVDEETAVFSTVSGDVEPLIRTSDGKAILARWNAPEDIQSVVLFDGGTSAGPVYTQALESAILAIDEERGSDVKRNRWWGHTIYETDAFVVDVATSQLKTLHDARPRQHEGVDVITGVINPTVHHGECAMILKDYVGPYAGGKGNWAVLAREQLVKMEPRSDSRLDVEAQGVTRVTRIGDDPIRLAGEAGFERVENQVMVWKKMREGQPAYSINKLDGGWELHVFSPEPFTVVAGQF